MKKRWAMLGGLGLGAGVWGLLAEAQGALEGPIDDDDALAERVRARLSPDGLASGDGPGVGRERRGDAGREPSPRREFDRLVSRVLRVRGVQDVNDQLDVRPTVNGARDFEDTPAE